MKSDTNNKSGFTLIEMIGVIAVIAILAAFVTPKVMQAIQDSRVTRFAGEINSYKSAVTRWYKDIGSLQSLTPAGALTARDASFQDALISTSGNTGLLWARWNGPYIDSVSNTSIGTTLTIRTRTGGTVTGAPRANNETEFDLDDDNVNDMSGRQVVSLVLTGVSLADFKKLDNMIDAVPAAGTPETGGKVKLSRTTMFVYLTSL